MSATGRKLGLRCVWLSRLYLTLSATRTRNAEVSLPHHLIFFPLHISVFSDFSAVCPRMQRRQLFELSPISPKMGCMIFVMLCSLSDASPAMTTLNHPVASEQIKSTERSADRLVPALGLRPQHRAGVPSCAFQQGPGGASPWAIPVLDNPRSDCSNRR